MYNYSKAVHVYPPFFDITCSAKNYKIAPALTLAKAERLDALLSEVDKAQRETAAIHNWTTIIHKYLNLQELDRAAIDELIDHIEIGERTVVDGQRRQDIKVFYRFVGQVE